MLLNSTILVKMRCNKSMSDRRAMHQERRLRILPLLVLTRLQKLKMNAPVAKAAEDAAVEEESNAAEIDGVGEVEMQDDDDGEESYAAEVQVEDTTIVSSDEVPEAEDEVAEAEAAEGTAVENDTNAAELDDSSQYLHLC
jgi:hypothetical protein